MTMNFFHKAEVWIKTVHLARYLSAWVHHLPKRFYVGYFLLLKALFLYRTPERFYLHTRNHSNQDYQTSRSASESPLLRHARRSFFRQSCSCCFQRRWQAKTHSLYHRANPKNKRRVPVDEHFLNIKPDIIVLTHDHLDHTDPDTLKHYITQTSGILLLAPENSWKAVRSQFGGDNNFVMFNRHTQWTEGDIRFSAVRAEHSDKTAIGFIL